MGRKKRGKERGQGDKLAMRKNPEGAGWRRDTGECEEDKG